LEWNNNKSVLLCEERDDQSWALLHRVEVIKSLWESVEEVVHIAWALGREIATPA
jgi:hypothetical protein